MPSVIDDDVLGELSSHNTAVPLRRARGGGGSASEKQQEPFSRTDLGVESKVTSPRE
jgi:hypothetical protein